MVKRLSELPEAEAKHLRRVECPTYEDTPALAGEPLTRRRVAIISTAGLHERGDRPFVRATAAIASSLPRRPPTSW